MGDIFWHPCSDELYRRSRDWFNGLRHPVVYTPGDNEWMDCWEPGSGGFAPQERLGRIRQIIFADPTRSLGGIRRSLVSQAGQPPFAEFVENARWAHDGFIFATTHPIGSTNGLRQFPQRTAADDVAAKRRTEAAAAWVRETFAQANAVDPQGVVFAFHGNPAFAEPVGDSRRQAFEPWMTVLEEEVERFPGPVLAVHGDGHVYTVDHPLVRRTTGRRLESFTRLQVPGSPGSVGCGCRSRPAPNRRSPSRNTWFRAGSTGSGRPGAMTPVEPVAPATVRGSTPMRSRPPARASTCRWF